MRLLHFSDLHLGIENYGRIDPQTGLHTRTLDLLAALDELVDFALARNIDLVLFTGDAYKNREPTQTHQREFAKRISRLSSGGIPVVLLVGNHDVPHAVAKATAVEIFDTLAVPKVHVAERFGTRLIETPRGPIQVVALPWVQRSSIASREETRGLTFLQQNQYIEEKLSGLLEREAQALDTSIPAVLAAHLWVHGAKVGSERGMVIGYDYTLPRSALINLGFDYIALGHIHRHQVLSYTPHMAYAGSLQRLDFSDEDEDNKGFYVVELDPKAGAGPDGRRVTAFDFHPIKSRAFVTVDVEITPQDEDPTATVVKAIQSKRITDAVVRLQVTIPVDKLPRLVEAEVRRGLEKAYSVAGITKNVLREVRPRMGAVTAERLSPLEALERYLAATNTSKDKAQKLLAYAEGLMKEVTAEGQG